MPIDQRVSSNLPAWPPEGTPTRGLNEDFSTIVFALGSGEESHAVFTYLNEDFSTIVFALDDVIETGLSKTRHLISVLTPSKPKVFDWDAAERRADWEESHSRFAEFNDVKDLLSDLHSYPASEAWLFNNSDAIASVRRGLNDAAQGRVSKVDLDTL